MKRGLLIILCVMTMCICGVFGLCACDGGQTPPAVISVTGVTLNESTVTLVEGEEYTLRATIKPSGATDKRVLWESADNDIATVSAEGIVTAISAGETTISITTYDGEFTMSCTVIVELPTDDGNPDEEQPHVHSYTTKVTAPTCTAEGYTTYACSCGDSYKGDSVSAKGHSYITKVTAPTCTESGYTTYTCSCGDSYTGNTVSAKGHSFTNYISNNDATTEKNGTMTASCTRNGCSATDTATELGTKKIEVKLYCDNAYRSSVYTSEKEGYTVSLPKMLCDEDITTNPFSAQYFDGWYRDFLCQTAYDKETKLKSETVLYSKILSADTSNFTFSVSNGEATIVGLNNKEMTSIVLPKYYLDYQITKIGRNAFANSTTVRKVIIFENIQSIESGAFSGCNSLMSLQIPNSVQSIGGSVVQGCTSLRSIATPFIGENRNATSNNFLGYFFGASAYSYNKTFVPESLKTLSVTGATTIGNYALSSCVGLNIVTIGDEVSAIGERAFYDCKGLTNVTIGNGVQTIKWGAFSNCTNLTKVTIPNSVTTLGTNTFSECVNLQNVEIGNRVSEIPSDMFWDCSKLVTIVIPSSVTKIGNHAFGSCESLKEMLIPNSVKSIGTGAFAGCTGLKTLRIGSGVTSIASGFFQSYNCNALESITVENGNTAYCSVENCLIDKINKELILACNNSVIPTDGSVTKISRYAFQYCKELRSLTIPSSVVFIGEFGFAGCVKLISVTFENNEGWQAGGRSVSSSDLADPSKAAQHLTTGYNYECSWTRI